MKKKMSPSDASALWLSRIVVWITIIVVLFPVVWIVMSSFSAGDSFFLSLLFPEKIAWMISSAALLRALHRAV